MHSYGCAKKTRSSTQRQKLVVFWEHPYECTHFKDVHTCICQSSVDTGLVAHRWLVRARAATKSSLASAPLKAVVAAVLNACSSLGIDPARGDTSISGLRLLLRALRVSPLLSAHTSCSCSSCCKHTAVLNETTTRTGTQATSMARVVHEHKRRGSNEVSLAGFRTRSKVRS